jgi:tRNA (guanine37-N1)-methyltransferase
MTFHIITIFPKIFDSYLKESIIARAQKAEIIKIKVHDLRCWTTDRHKTVDDAPYGGGAGMVMKVEPVYKAIKHLTRGKKKKSRKIILLSAKGKIWSQQKAQKYSRFKEIIFICGHYEGVDERVKNFVDEEISVGNYVLTGGELPALIILDSITRLLPEALGNKESIFDESHSQKGVLEYPQYTRPETFTVLKKKHKVPKVLLSGNHRKIKEWREKNKKYKKL